MSSPLFEKRFPGSSTALVIGSSADIDPVTLSGYRHILWWADSAFAALPSALAGHPSIRVVAIDNVNPADFADSIDSFLLRDPRHLPAIYITAGIDGPSAKAYGELINKVYERVEIQQRVRLTRQRDGFAWQRNLLENASCYSRHPLPSSWAGALKGLPSFVVGAGPSLDVSLPCLARFAANAVIFAADSSLHALGRVNLGADFAVSIDAAKVPDLCIPAGTPVPGKVALALTSPPAWQTVVPSERLFFVSGRQVSEDWLISLGAMRPGVGATESCGSTALELAIFLGCDPIYLFGIDLAVDSKNRARRHHNNANEGLYAKSNYDSTAALPNVPGNYTATVPCFAIGDWRELDRRLAALRGPQIYNVNDRGAKLRGASLLHPSDFSLSAPAGAKTAPLAALAPEIPDAASAASALASMRNVGLRGSTALPRLRDALAHGGPPAVSNVFRLLVTDSELGRFLGAFALKLMPHLFPPTEGDMAFWQLQIDEFEALTNLAAKLG